MIAVWTIGARAAFLACLFLLAPPTRAQEKEPAPYEPPRDYGTDWRPAIVAGYSTEDGLYLGGGPILYGFAFRRLPYAFRMQWTGVLAPRTGAFRVSYDALFPALGARTGLRLHAGVSTMEVRSYYGRGNTAPRDAEADEERFYRAGVVIGTLRPELRFRLSRGAELFGGPSAAFVNVRNRRDRYLTPESLAVLGDTRLTAGLRAGFVLDTRDEPAAARSGWLAAAEGRADAGLHGWRAPVQRLSGDLRGYLTPSFAPRVTFAARAAGEKVWGRYPWYEAAFLGGQGSLRGFNAERFAGDAAVAGSCEVRVFLLRMLLLVPAGVSLTAFADAGRVWVDGRSPGPWHTGAGGGLLIAPVAASNTLSVSVAGSADGLFITAAVGAAF